MHRNIDKSHYCTTSVHKSSTKSLDPVFIRLLTIINETSVKLRTIKINNFKLLAGQNVQQTNDSAVILDDLKTGSFILMQSLNLQSNLILQLLFLCVCVCVCVCNYTGTQMITAVLSMCECYFVVLSRLRL